MVIVRNEVSVISSVTNTIWDGERTIVDGERKHSTSPTETELRPEIARETLFRKTTGIKKRLANTFNGINKFVKTIKYD